MTLTLRARSSTQLHAAFGVCCAFFAIVILLSASAATAVAQTAQSPIPLPSPFTPIVDYAHVIDPETRQKLESIYVNLKERANIEFAVVTVDTTGDQDIFEYSLAVARGWGIGSKGGEKAGLLLLVAIKDRKYFTQVSDHLEGDLNDGLVGQIQRERLVPQFKKGNYGQGIYDTIQVYVATLAEKRGFNIEGIDQGYAYREAPQNTGRGSGTGGIGSRAGGLSNPCCTMIIILFVAILLISLSRRGGRGGGGGCLNLFLLGSLFNSGGKSGGWGGSSSGWGGGGFGGGGGGFGGGFGGGGSFGGGGAGGGW